MVSSIEQCPVRWPHPGLDTPQALFQVCGILERWIQQTLHIPGVAQAPVMRNFLCAEADRPPPGIQFTPVAPQAGGAAGGGAGGGLGEDVDDLEMDEMFDDDDDQSTDLYDDDQLPPTPPFDGASTPPAPGGHGGGGGGGGYADAVAMTVGSLTVSNMKAGSQGSVPAPLSKLTLDCFKVIRVIGKGSFGKVFLVREKQSNQVYAMKVLNKDNVIRRNQVEHTRTERCVAAPVRAAPASVRAATSEAPFFFSPVPQVCTGLHPASVHRGPAGGVPDEG